VVDDLIGGGLDLELAADPSAPRRARTSVVGVLDGEDGVDLDVVALLVSELVTNVVLHTRSTARVRVRQDARRIRVEVSDDHPPLPVIRSVGGPQVSGRGLRIVEQLADRWGVEAHVAGPAGPRQGKTVWFELDRREFRAPPGADPRPSAPGEPAGTTGRPTSPE
jgi:anti-sigma regulatory factor (Ser/Thr protein kinase)